jgi:hypothetical protein
VTSHEVGVQIGYLVALVGIPVVGLAIGLICLMAGLRSRNRVRSGPSGDSGYPYPPAPPTTYAPRPRRGKRGTTLIVIGAVLLTLGALGVAGNLVRPRIVSPFDAGTSMRVGECIDQNAFFVRSFSSRPANDCANPSNTYELAFKGNPSATCPDGKRDHSVYDRFTDESIILCFALNLKQGQCYQLTNGDDNLTMGLGDCSRPRPSQVRVVERIDGSADKTRCPPGGRAIAYPTPARVYCLSPQ